MKLTNPMKISALLLVISATLLIPFSAAQAAQPGVYMGMGFGSAHDQILNEDESAYKIYGGVNLTRHIGMELAYVDLGTYANGALNQDGVSYQLVGYVPLAPHLDLFGKGGFFNWEVSDSFSSNTGTDATFGLGLQAQLQRYLSLRGEYQTYLDVDGGDVDLYSVSVSFHF